MDQAYFEQVARQEEWEYELKQRKLMNAKEIEQAMREVREQDEE